MRFLIDACAASQPVLAALKDAGCDVVSVLERMPHAPDEAVLALALEENRVLVTEDNDFGELVFLQGLPHAGIVRLVDMTPAERADIMRFLLETYTDAMRDGAIIVVTKDRIRIRRPQSADMDDG
ncbi:MAG: DUF5615 family PIN-like protein [Gammaproteobacteria bacterium]|nr:DUF5615 family PIN-like protein [Gammaproteobacteria bacterium]